MVASRAAAVAASSRELEPRLLAGCHVGTYPWRQPTAVSSFHATGSRSPCALESLTSRTRSAGRCHLSYMHVSALVCMEVKYLSGVPPATRAS